MILFGSYARGDWVADPIGGYYSDYDILVVVNHDELADTTAYWTGAEDHLLREFEIAQRIRTPVNLIVQSVRRERQAEARASILRRHRAGRHRAVRGTRSSL